MSGLRPFLEVWSDHRFSVVFSYWRSTLDLIQSALAHASVITVRFDGGLSPKDRQASVDKFRKDSSVQVMLLTLSCGAVGWVQTHFSVDLGLTRGIQIDADCCISRIPYGATLV